MDDPISENELWLLSFYRISELSGALFFGRLARALRAGPIQHDLTRHFADESQHAWYWTRCIAELGAEPISLGQAYQDRYLAAAGLPANLMEVLAITQVFEARVIGQYNLHRHTPTLRPAIKKTLDRILEDEKWHIQWVRAALEGMTSKYGKERVRATLERYAAADREVYRQTIAEHEQRVVDLMRLKRR
jgi:hypothetical protein